MQKISTKSLVSALANDKPVLIFFHSPNDQSKKIKQMIHKIEKNMPLLPSYEFITDETPENEFFCDQFEIPPYPIILVFKDGCFNRYKSKSFTEKSISNFIGNSKKYKPA